MAKLKSPVWLGSTLGILESVSGLVLSLFFQVQGRRGISAGRLCPCSPAALFAELLSTSPSLREMHLFITRNQGSKSQGRAWHSTRKASVPALEMPCGQIAILYFCQGASTCNRGKHTGSDVLNYFSQKCKGVAINVTFEILWAFTFSFSKVETLPPYGRLWGAINVERVVQPVTLFPLLDLGKI